MTFWRARFWDVGRMLTVTEICQSVVQLCVWLIFLAECETLNLVDVGRRMHTAWTTTLHCRSILSVMSVFLIRSFPFISIPLSLRKHLAQTCDSITLADSQTFYWMSACVLFSYWPYNNITATDVCVNNRLNGTMWNTTNTTATPTPSSTTPVEVVLLPDKGEVEKEHHYSMTIFFILLVLGKLLTLLHQLFVGIEGQWESE